MTTYVCMECGARADLEGFMDNESPECECGGDMLPVEMF